MAVKVTNADGTTTMMNRAQFMEFMKVLWEQAQENKDTDTSKPADKGKANGWKSDDGGKSFYKAK